MVVNTGTQLPVQKTNMNTSTPEALAQARLKKQCREFESVFYNSMLKAMRKTIIKTDLFDGGKGEEIYTSMLDEEYAKIMSKNGNDSLANALYNQLKKHENI